MTWWWFNLVLHMRQVSWIAKEPSQAKTTRFIIDWVKSDSLRLNEQLHYSNFTTTSVRLPLQIGHGVHKIGNNSEQSEFPVDCQ